MKIILTYQKSIAPIAFFQNKNRCGWESNPRIRVLQTLALPLGHRTIKTTQIDIFIIAKTRIPGNKIDIFRRKLDFLKWALIFYCFSFILLVRERHTGPF